MAKILSLADAQALEPGWLRDQAYNALDCTGTRAAADKLLEYVRKYQITYDLERALQAPFASMALRGVRINTVLRADMVSKLKRRFKKAQRIINLMPQVKDFWDGTELETGWCPAELGKRHKWPRGEPDSPARKCERCRASRVRPLPFNPNATDQIKHLLYELHGIRAEQNKEGEDSVDGECLTRIGSKNPEFRELTDRIIEVKDMKKQLGSLGARLSPLNRYHSSFNVGTAWTGRASSSKAAALGGIGGNLQNWAEEHRSCVIADPGMDIGYADYMQGESNIVAHLSGDERYIEAHLIGDVHTYAARLIWPELPWTGDMKKDKAIAKQNPPWDTAEGHSYRFQAKRFQHGCNYGLTPRGISMIEHIPYEAATAAYQNYMTQFDGIPAWHAWVQNQIAAGKHLTNPLFRSTKLMGRAWDKRTVRQGLSFLPQSLLADILDIALWRIWWELEEHGVQLLAQVHDAVLHQIPRGDMELERAMLQLMKIPVPVTDIHGKTRVMTIGVESATGQNWGHKSESNPLGIDEAPIAEYLHEHPLD